MKRTFPGQRRTTSRAPSPNRLLVCAAGGGKTTRIVDEALASGERCALVTYTHNNEAQIRAKLCAASGVIPARIEVNTWISFLIRELARPYQRAVYEPRIEGIFPTPGRSAEFSKETDVARHYFADGRLIYTDKLAKFVCKCNAASSGAVIKRLAHRFDHVVIDEVQDLAGYDIDILELMLKSGIRVTLVGDHRQATYRTNNAAKNRGYAGINILKKLREWDTRGVAVLSFDTHTHRCSTEIAKLGDSFFPGEPATVSCNNVVTDHDGVFVVRTARVAEYVSKFRPQVLRYDVKTDVFGLPAMNFGAAKGLTFERVLIFPHKAGQKWIKSGDYKHVEGSKAKMYVAVTRARQSVAFVTDDLPSIAGMRVYTDF